MTAEEDDEDNKAEVEAKDCHAIEVAQSWTGLDHEELETASTDRPNMSPETYSCKGSGKTPELVVVPEGPVRSQHLVLDISQRSSYLEIDRIREFLDCHESAEVTRKELRDLGNLERALDREWKHARRLATSEGLDTSSGPDNSISILGMAVGDTLRSSR